MAQDLTPNTHLPANTLIKQPVSQDLRSEPGSMQLIEKWKGQYVHCQDVVRSLYGVSADVDYGRFTAAAGVLCSEYATPYPPSGLKWTYAQGTVDELDAGENGILTIVWNAKISGDAPSKGLESWNLQWQPENYDPYAYCSNVSAHVDPGGNPLKSQRVAVEQCLHPPTGNNVMTNSRLFQDNQGTIRRLNENEQKILKWKLEGLHVIKHHPVISRQNSFNNVAASAISAVLAAHKDLVKIPDVVDSAPSQMAQNMGLSSYTWVCQGTTIQTSQPDIAKNEWSVNYTTQWQGASLSVVEEFYSDDNSKRWKFGEM